MPSTTQRSADGSGGFRIGAQASDRSDYASDGIDGDDLAASHRRVYGCTVTECGGRCGGWVKPM